MRVFWADTPIISEPAPGQRADVAVAQAVALARGDAGGVDLRHAVGDGEVEDLGALEQALGVFAKLEDLAVVHALAFEHAGGVVHAVGQDVDLGVAPGHEAAVQPDPAVAVVEGRE
jgi:hypothetical protein